MMLKADFFRITSDGPTNLTEYLWYYLYQNGLESAPLAWELERTWLEFSVPLGMAFLPLVEIASRMIYSFAKRIIRD